MSSKSVAEKLGIAAGDRVLLLDPPESYDETLGPVPEDADLAESPDGTFDIVQLFVRDRAAFEDGIQSSMDATNPDGRLWVTYPKRSSDVDSDLSRDVLADLMDHRGWRGARQIAVDETWSAIWFRPND